MKRSFVHHPLNCASVPLPLCICFRVTFCYRPSPQLIVYTTLPIYSGLNRLYLYVVDGNYIFRPFCFTRNGAELKTFVKHCFAQYVLLCSIDTAVKGSGRPAG